jgi:signal transduction histidine kinase
VSDVRLVWFWRTVAVVGVALTAAGLLFLYVSGNSEAAWKLGTPWIALFPLSFAPLIWIVVARQPRNSVLWVLAASAFFWGVYAAGGAALAITYPGDVGALLADQQVAPVDLSGPEVWVMTFTFTGWLPALFPLVTLGLLLFPDGTLPSPRWRWVVALTLAGITISTVGSWWTYWPGSSIPYNERAFESASTAAMIVGALVTVAVSFAALVTRFRRSRGEVRQQFKWVVWGGTVFVVGLFASFLFEGSRYEGPSDVLFLSGGGAFVASYWIAVGKYRLYDVDVVISRTFVYGLLAVFITGMYVVAVLGVGGLLGGDVRSSRWLSIGATALVAFAFEPLRARLQRLANRLVYGRRATPYEVLSDFSHRIGADEEELLGQVARSLAEGTTAAGASVWVTVDSSLRRVAAWPEAGVGRSPIGPGPPAEDVLRPVVHDGETLGVLALSPGRGQSVLAADERLLDQVGQGMGLALRNLRLGEDLRRQVDKLGQSRHRLLAVADVTRRQLERELHDGAQQRLVALKVKLALARGRAQAAGNHDVSELLDQVAADTGRAVESLRDLARGIYPPLLEAEGLRAALAAQVQTLPLPVIVEAAGLPRFSPEVEAAVYFCVLEALQNVAKHARAVSAQVILDHMDGELIFEVSDDGEGFDLAAVASGSGLANLADRLDALDGTIHIDTAPGQGTTVRGAIPIPIPGSGAT